MWESSRQPSACAARSKRRLCRTRSGRRIWGGDVLLRPSSPAPWSSGLGPSHPCAKCGTDTPGIAIGGLCANCTRLLERRASRVARLVAIGTTAPLAVYVALAPPVERAGRIAGAAGVAPGYGLVFLLGKRE